MADLSAFSQGGFYMRHHTSYFNEIYAVVETDNGFLYVGATDENSDTTKTGYALFTDKQGVIQWEKKHAFNKFDIHDFEIYNSVVFHANYFYVGGYVNRNGLYNYSLTKLDLNGDVIFKKALETPTPKDGKFLKKIVLDNDGIIIAGQVSQSSYYSEKELFRCDFEGNVLWSKTITSHLDSLDNGRFFKDLKQGKDGSLLALLYPYPTANPFSYATILRMNQTGEKIWEKTFDTICPSILTNDNLMLWGATPFKENHTLAYFRAKTPNIPDEENTYPIVSIAIIEYDEFGNEIDYNRFDNQYVYAHFVGNTDINTNIYTTKKDEIFIVGTRDYTGTGLDSNRLSILKLNIDKEIEWEKHYFKKYDAIVDSANLKPQGELFTCGMPTSDNGFILIGSDYYKFVGDEPFIYHYNSTIIKIDCNGNTVWDYSSCLSPKFDDITIFPNPSSDNFIIQLPNIQEKDNVQIKVYDPIGKLIAVGDYKGKDVINLNSSSWAIGTYICHILVNNQAVKTEKLLKINGI